MVLGIVLCANIQCVYIAIFILMKMNVHIVGGLFAFLVAMVFFTWLLSIASIMMNVMFIKMKRYFYKRNYVGLAFSILCQLLCLLMAVLGILVRQRWLEPDLFTSLLTIRQLFI